MPFTSAFIFTIAAWLLVAQQAYASTMACSPDSGPNISFRELPREEQYIGHPLEVVIEGEEGLSQVSLLESLRGRSFVEVIDGRTVFRLYLNYDLDPNGKDYVVIQASDNKGATRCRAMYVRTHTPDH